MAAEQRVSVHGLLRDQRCLSHVRLSGKLCEMFDKKLSCILKNVPSEIRRAQRAPQKKSIFDRANVLYEYVYE